MNNCNNLRFVIGDTLFEMQNFFGTVFDQSNQCLLLLFSAVLFTAFFFFFMLRLFQEHLAHLYLYLYCIGFLLSVCVWYSSFFISFFLSFTAYLRRGIYVDTVGQWRRKSESLIINYVLNLLTNYL